jgi:hypothetical protein
MHNLKEIIISNIKNRKEIDDKEYNIKCNIIESKTKLNEIERKTYE